MASVKEAESSAGTQFDVRALLGFAFGVCSVLAAYRIGIPALVAFGAPLAILGYRVISGRRVALAVTPLVVCVVFAALTLLVVTPADLNGWLAILGGVVWTLLLGTLSPSPRQLILAIPPGAQFLLFLYCWQPRFVEGQIPYSGLGGRYIQDVRGSRSGIEKAGIRFVTDTNNADLIEKHLGPIEPQWKHSSYIAPGIRDGNERVDSGSIIRCTCLGEMLEVLPSEAAKRQVLICVTDPNNRARIHQGLLVIAIRAWGYPPGYDAETWWTEHAHLFKPMPDPTVAAKTVWGWRERIGSLISASHHDGQELSLYEEYLSTLCSAARYQEQGTWGGDRDFGECYDMLPGTMPPPLVIPKNVVWWPEP